MRKIRIKTRFEADMPLASAFLRPGRNRMLKRSRRRRFIRQGTGAGVVVLVGSALLSWGALEGWKWLQRTTLLATNQTILRGVQRSDSDHLRAVLARHHGQNLLSVDLTTLRRDLIRDPWVADASVQRVLPDTLTAEVVERKPVAVAVLFGMLTLVDREGRPIVPWNQKIGSLDLPLITGLDDPDAKEDASHPTREEARRLVALAREGLEILTVLRRHDPGLMDGLSEVDLSRPDRVIVRLVDEPAPLYLDRNDVTLNLDHYMAVREDIRARQEATAAIDLRWRGRVVVVPSKTAREASYGSERHRTAGEAA